MSETSFIKRFDITLDLKQPGCGGDFSVVDGDTGNVVYLALTDAGIPVSVEGRRIIAAFSNSRGKYMQDSAESGGGISVSDDKVKLQLRPQSFAPGIVECELQIYSGGTENSAAGATVYDSLVTNAKFNFSCLQRDLRCFNYRKRARRTSAFRSSFRNRNCRGGTR